MNRKVRQDEPEDIPRKRRISKKSQILSLFTSGIESIEDLAIITSARPSYVASVLQAEGLVSGYFDLYTTSAHPMNVYSHFFAGKLGFKTEEAARESVHLLDRFYRQFEFAGDRAGQHHALMMGLTMFDRARWTAKTAEAEIYRQWLMEKLEETNEMRDRDSQADALPIEDAELQEYQPENSVH